MKTDLVKLRVVTAFNVYRVGDVIERMPSVAQVMLTHRWYGRKLVELAAEPEPVPVPELVTAKTLESSDESHSDLRPVATRRKGRNSREEIG